MPLNLADKNKIYIIQRIVGNKDMVHRLQSLGFVVEYVKRIIVA